MRTSVIAETEAESENVLAAERGNVDEYVAEREKIEDTDMLAGLRELDGAASIRWECHRIGDIDASRNGWVCDIPLEMLTLQHVSNMVGPGTYQVVGKYSNGRYAARRTIRIAGDARRAVSNGSGNGPGGIQGGGSPFNMSDWERIQDQRDERRRKERNDMLALIIPAAAPIVAALLGRQGPDMAALITALKPPPPPDPIATLAALKALQGEDKPSANPIDTAFKLLEKFQDMAPSDGGTSWLDVAKEAVRTVGPTLGGLIEGAIAKNGALPAIALPGATAATRPLSIDAPGATHDSAEAVTSENPQMLAYLRLLPWLKSQIEMALQKAAQGSDPGLIAARIIDDIPNGIDHAQLIEFIQRPDWWQQMCRFEQRVIPHQAWFAEMRQAMIEETGQGSAPAPTPMSVREVGPDEIDRPGEPPKLGL